MNYTILYIIFSSFQVASSLLPHAGSFSTSAIMDKLKQMVDNVEESYLLK